MTQIKSLLESGTRSLVGSSPSPRLDAELLLAHVLEATRLVLFSDGDRTVSEKIEVLFQSLIKRRVAHEPIAYLLGYKEFWGATFQVSPAVLIPRPETELLVEEALRVLEPLENPRILDCGTGSGCIAISIARERKRNGKQSSIVALDSSDSALAVAKANARVLGASEITFVKSDWFDALEKTATFDLIVSNPPYVSKDSKEQSPELQFEPSAALYADRKGLSAILQLLAGAPVHLAKSGTILMEIGAGQHDELLRMPELSQYRSVEFLRDLANHHRVICCTV